MARAELVTTEHEIPVDGGTLYAFEAGEGPPLLLIQGLGYATWGWVEQVPAFAERHRVIAFDNRGAGRSFKQAGEYSIEQMADDAAAVLQSLGAAPAHVLGFSMGGYIAQTLALRHPTLVRSLVLCGTSAGGDDRTPVPQTTLDVWLSNAHLPPEEYARATMYLSYSPGWTDEHPDAYERYLAMRLRHPTPPECWRAQFDACDRFLQAGAPVEQLDVPVLVLHGDQDRIVPVENGRVMAPRLRNGRLRILEGRGHLACLETPEEFNDAVLSFLDEVGGR